MIQFYLLVLLTVSRGGIGIIRLKDYCFINELNTPCLYGCTRSPVCGVTTSKFRTLTEYERRFILDCHNYYRDQVAGGQYADNTHIGLPAARNMRALSYDKECEFFAACYIRQCNENNNNVRVALDGTKLGQNIYRLSVTAPLTQDTFEDVLGSAIEHWFCESDKLQYSVTNFSYNGQIVKHPGIANVTYLIWGSGMYVGCAKFHSKSQKGINEYTVICVYKIPEPISQSIYEVGPVSCRVKCDKWQNLCGTIRTYMEDPFFAPIPLGGKSNIITYNFTLLNILLCIAFINK